MRRGKALATKEAGKSTGELGGGDGGDEERVNEAGPDHQRLKKKPCTHGAGFLAER